MKPKIKQLLLSKNISKEKLNLHINEHISPEKIINKTFQKFYIKKDIINNKKINDFTTIKKENKKAYPSFRKIPYKKNNSYLNKKDNKSFNNKESNTQNLKSTIIQKKNFNKKRKIIKFNINPVKNKTVFEQMIEDIDRIKIKTNRTLDIIKKNVKISNKEVSNRANKILNIDKLLKNLMQYSHQNYLNNKKSESFHNNNEFNINFSENNINNFLDYVSEVNLNKSSAKENYSYRKSQEQNIGHKFLNNLGMIKIPSISLNSIKVKDVGYNLYDKMYHYRNFYLSEEILENKFEKLFSNDNLIGNNLYIKEAKLQLNDIVNKLNLVLDNIEYFKSNYMHKGIFYSAFDNMRNKQKAEFNSVIEETCVLLIKIVPKLLKKFYENLDKLLYVNIPDINQEMEKNPENEKECLNFNYTFFNIVSFYFYACVDILKEIKKRIEYFKYTYSEYIILNKYINLARYNTSKINSIAQINILKTMKDKEILEKFEIGLGIKEKKNDFNDNILDRYHKRHQQKLFQETSKLDRINSAINFKNKSYSPKKLSKIGLNGNNKFILEKREMKSILNNPVIINMMKYFKKNIKSQIISQQVIERYKIKE